jgi:hypothetical protein
MVLYADGVKKYEELAKRGSSTIFFAPLAKELGDFSIQKMNFHDKSVVMVLFAGSSAIFFWRL